MNLFKEFAMHISTKNKDYIIKSIENFPPQKVQQLIDYIEYLKISSDSESSAVDISALILQQNSLAKIWQDEENLYEL